MFGKLLLLILGVTLTAGCLLVTRQRRLDIAHQAAQLHRRLNKHEMTLWELQSRIAERCQPRALRLALDAQDEQWIPIPARPRLVPLPPLAVAGAEHAARPDEDLGG